MKINPGWLLLLSVSTSYLLPCPAGAQTLLERLAMAAAGPCRDGTATDEARCRVGVGGQSPGVGRPRPERADAQLLLSGSCETVDPATAPPSRTSPEADLAPPVEQLVALALDRAPSLAALLARLEATRARAIPEGARPDTMTTIGWQEADFPGMSLGRDPMSMLTFGIRQPFLYGGKRAARRGAAESETLVREREVEQLRRQLAAGVRTISARLYALDRQRRTAEDARELLEMLAATAAARYGVGEGGQESVVKAQLEVSRLDERLDDLAADRAGLVAELNRLLDRRADAPMGEVTALPDVAAPVGDLEALAEQHSGAVGMRAAEVAALERRVAAARLDVKPNFSAGVAVGYRGGLPPVLIVDVGVEWPWDKKHKQEPLIAAAERDTDAARQELRDERAAVRAEAARALAEWQRAERQIARYQQAILPQTSAAVDAARAAYLAGRGDFSTIVEDFRLWLDARAELATREAARFEAWALLQVLTAGSPAVGNTKEN